MRQNLVVDFDELQGLARGGCIDCRHGSDRMAVVERLLAGHAVFQDVAHGAVAVGEIGQIGAGDHRFHAGELFRLGGVDLPDSGVRMRRAQDEADEMAGRHRIGAVFGAAGDLVHSVGTERTSADELEFLSGETGIERHDQFPLISCAASWTARTILS